MQKNLFAFCLLSLSFITNNIYADQITGCQRQQIVQIVQAKEKIKERIQVLLTELPQYDLNYVYENFILPKNRPWEEGSIQNYSYTQYLQSIYTTFSSIDADLDKGIHWKCEPTYQSQCQQGEVIAYVLFIGNRPLKTIHLCSGYFNTPVDRQVETGIHELSHYSAATDDLALSWLEPGKFIDLKGAANDAFHLERFSSGDIVHTLRTQVWFWNWLK